MGNDMRVEVDLAKCTGHGICESIAEDYATILGPRSTSFSINDTGLLRSTQR